MILRSDQLNAFQDQGKRRFILEAIGYLRKAAPHRWAQSSDQAIEAFILTQTDVALSYGIDQPQQLATTFRIASFFGDQFWQELPFSAIAADENLSSAVKIDFLEMAAMRLGVKAVR